MNDRLTRICVGAVAGLAATVPMSLVMLGGRRKSFWKYFDPLPPRQITTTALETIGLDTQLSDESEEALTVFNHFAYGASMGGVYGLLTKRQQRLPATRLGVLYGLGVWTVSYLGWLPATGFYRPATEDSGGRNLRMLAAHVVWGGTLGFLTELLDSGFGKRPRVRTKRLNGAIPTVQARIKPR